MSENDLTSDEVKQAIADAVSEATEGLKAKNAELLGKLKKAQQGQQIDPADLQAVEAERDQLKTELANANKALKKANTDLEAANKRAEEIDGAYTGSLKDAALTEALTKAGVTPALLKAAKALHGSNLQVVDDNGSRQVKAGDKALADFITEWAASEEGKYFVAAPDTNGGGAQNGGRGNLNNGDKVPDLTDKAGRAARYNAQLASAQE